MEEINKIIRGNDFSLCIKASKVIDEQSVPVSFADFTDLQVHLIKAYSNEFIAMPFVVNNDGDIIVPVSGLGNSTYGIEIKGLYGGNNWRWARHGLFRIVECEECSNTVDSETVDVDEYIVNVPVGQSALTRKDMEDYINEKMFIEEVSVSVDNEVGTPSGSGTFSNGLLSLVLHCLKGVPGQRGNGITSFEQVEQSDEDNGINTWRVIETDGRTTYISIKNGRTGSQGTSAIWNAEAEMITELENTTGGASNHPMSQKATTEMYDEEDVYEGWGYTGSKYIKDNDSEGSGSAYAYTDYIPLTSLKSDDRLVANKLKVNTVSSPSWHAVNFYDASKQVLSTHLNTTSINIAKRDMPDGAAFVRLNYTNNTYPTIKFVRCGAKRISDAETRLDALDIQQVTASVVRQQYIKAADGALETDTRFSRTDFIDLKGARAVHSSEGSLRSVGNIFGQVSSSVATIAFYDANKAFIANSDAHYKYAECPEGAAYIRCTVPLAASSTVVTLYGASEKSRLETVENTVSKINNSVFTGLEGKTVAFIGDSITERVGFDDAYHKVFADLMGCTNVNLGKNATTIANHPTNGMGSDRFITRATSENLSNADMVVIFGGTNDFTYDSKPIGNLFVEETITSTGDIGSKKLVAPTDTDTFAGALHELILQVRSIIGEKPIILMTPLNRGRYGTGKPTTREANLQGNYLMDFVNAIKEIGRFYGIPVFDSGGVFNIDMTDENTSEYSGDLLHPNTKGHYRLGVLLYKWVCQNIYLN